MSDLNPTAFRGYFGDAEHVFELTPPMVAELERKAGAGIGVIVSRVSSMLFGYVELIETIRLGLIGGGMSGATKTGATMCSRTSFALPITSKSAPLRGCHIVIGRTTISLSPRPLAL